MRTIMLECSAMAPGTDTARGKKMGWDNEKEVTELLIKGDNGELWPSGLWRCKHFIMNIGLNYIELNISRNTKHFFYYYFAVNTYIFILLFRTPINLSVSTVFLLPIWCSLVDCSTAGGMLIVGQDDWFRFILNLS